MSRRQRRASVKGIEAQPVQAEPGAGSQAQRLPGKTGTNAHQTGTPIQDNLNQISNFFFKLHWI